MNNVDYKLLSKMPKPLADFIQHRAKTDYLVLEDDVIICDAHLPEVMTNATFYIEKAKPQLSARFVYLMDIRELVSNYVITSNVLNEAEKSTVKEEMNEKHEELVKLIKKSGYQFYPSHDVKDGVSAYWDILVHETKWNEDTFTVLWKRLDQVTTEILDLLEKAGVKF